MKSAGWERVIEASERFGCVVMCASSRCAAAAGCCGNHRSAVAGVVHTPHSCGVTMLEAVYSMGSFMPSMACKQQRGRQREG